MLGVICEELTRDFDLYREIVLPALPLRDFVFFRDGFLL